MNSQDLISCIIPTYNRSPESGDRVRFNPIWWAANSLFGQVDENKSTVVGEIIFIDDASCDYSNLLQTVEMLKTRVPGNLEIKCLRNTERLGSGKSRNIGVSHSKNENLFFMDDDCVAVDSSILYKLREAYKLVRERGIKIGALNLPVSGNSSDSPLSDPDLIGKVNPETGIMEGCYTKFPNNYLQNLDNFTLDLGLGLLEPLPVEFMGGVFLTTKKVYENAGGFPSTPWRNGYTEEPDLIKRMAKLGHQSFYLPSLDKHFRVFHCRFGDPEFNRVPYDMNVDGVHFNDVLSLSSVSRNFSHGNRVSRDEYLETDILANMLYLGKWHDKKILENNVDYRYRTALSDNDPKALTRFRSALDRAIRFSINGQTVIDQKLGESLRERYL
jgi:glycosyltransferase involved in cell wall biosynthesis